MSTIFPHARTHAMGCFPSSCMYSSSLASSSSVSASSSSVSSPPLVQRIFPQSINGIILRPRSACMCVHKEHMGGFVPTSKTEGTAWDCYMDIRQNQLCSFDQPAAARIFKDGVCCGVDVTWQHPTTPKDLLDAYNSQVGQ